MATVTTGDGQTIHYDDQGTGEPVVLLHGLGSSALDWEQQVEHLMDRYRVLVPEIRGHGRSSAPSGPYTIGGFAADVAAVLDGVAVGPAHVVGLSLGGGIALQLALDRPDLVRSLVIVNSGPEAIPRTWAERVAIWVRLVLVRTVGPSRMAGLIAKRLFPEPDQEELRRTFVERMQRNDPAAYRAATEAIIGWTVTDRLGEIAQPTLVVTSDHDYTPVDRKEEYVALLPHARLEVMEDAHHAVNVERPDRFNAVLEHWFAEQGATRA